MADLSIAVEAIFQAKQQPHLQCAQFVEPEYPDNELCRQHAMVQVPNYESFVWDGIEKYLEVVLIAGEEKTEMLQSLKDIFTVDSVRLK